MSGWKRRSDVGTKRRSEAKNCNRECPARTRVLSQSEPGAHATGSQKTHARPMPSSNPHRRLALSLNAALLLGAITTVAISWTFAVGSNLIFHQQSVTVRTTPGTIWLVQQLESHGAAAQAWTPFDGMWREGQSAEVLQSLVDSLTGPGIMRSLAPPTTLRLDELFGDDRQPINFVEHSRGWPLLALGYVVANEPTSMGAPYSTMPANVRWGCPSALASRRGIATSLTSPSSPSSPASTSTPRSTPPSGGRRSSSVPSAARAALPAACARPAPTRSKACPQTRPCLLYTSPSPRD